MEKETKKKDKKTESWVLVTVLVIGLLLAAAFGGYLVGASQVAREMARQKAESRKQTQKEKVLEVNDKVKAKLEKFVTTGLYFDHAGNETWNYFSKEVTSISKGVKLQMAFNATKTDTKGLTLSDEEKSKLKGVKPEANETVVSMKKSDFDNAYKELFNEEPKYEFDEMRGCPAPMAMNEETGVIYLFSRCGGTGTFVHTDTIDSYDSDKDFYYVHSKTVIKDESVDKEPSTTTKLVWKFDKDLNFVSTEKE